MALQVTIFSINNYLKLKNLNLHDSELHNIRVDYLNKEIQVQFVTAVTPEVNSNQIFWVFKEVYDFNITMKEPWGSGFYVNSIEFDEFSDRHIKTIVLLNSGDEINCISEIIKLE
ncbi:hypothetical protein MHH33_08980 [Paenisporosarcina sp. FSL H8-0542]|uniref:hypothetical protein n=1 Tax=Paenisporosarcina sp. FSL H8-0542 TaxID=2921401 RepID=UPI003159FA07